MNRMNKEEFEDRVRAVQEARQIFIELTGGNITRAFEAYQLILAQRDREIMINTLMGNRPPSPLDRFERPKCPDCGSDFLFRPLPPNPEGYKVLLECSNPQCQVRLYSEMTIEEWVKEMQNVESDEKHTL